MTRKTISKICTIISIILLITFAVKTVINYFQYDPVLNSAPFSTWILVNALFLIIPAVIVFIVGLLIGRKK